MKRHIELFIFITLVIALASCKSNITDSPPSHLEPGRRDYIWEEYELNSTNGESVRMGDIWGANPLDVWTVGNCSSYLLGVWHYDGNRFVNINSTNTSAQSSIWGSSANDIWIGSAGGVVWHYSGSEWTVNAELKYRNYTKFAIQKLWGVSSNEVYAVGAKLPGDVNDSTFGAVFKYDGLKWNDIKITKNNLNFYDIAKDKNGDIIIAAMGDKNLKESVHSWNGSQLKELFPPASYGSTDLICQNGNVYVARNKVVYKYESGAFVLFKDFTGTNMTTLKCMRNEKDIFIGYNDSAVYGLAHYNGSDIKLLYQTSPDFYVINGILFDKNIFFILRDNIHSKTKILHGKLKSY